jgi:hypothetical protein
VSGIHTRLRSLERAFDPGERPVRIWVVSAAEADDTVARAEAEPEFWTIVVVNLFEDDAPVCSNEGFAP